MKKKYDTPIWRLHCVKSSDIIITSDPQVSDDPSDGGQMYSRRRDSDWENFF